MEIKIDEIDIQFLKGVGPKRAEMLHKHGIHTIQDLLFYFPTRHVDRSQIIPLRELETDMDVTVIVQVLNAKIIPGKKRRLQVSVSDKTGLLTVVFFAQPDSFRKVFQPGITVALSGKVGYYKGYQLVHPDFEILSENNKKAGIHTSGIIPMYRIPEDFRKRGLNTHILRKIIFTALQKYETFISNGLPDYIINQNNLLDRKTAVRNMHFPESDEKLNSAAGYFKFEEIFYFMLLMEIQRNRFKAVNTGITFKNGAEIIKELESFLPFSFTPAQAKVLSQIKKDMEKSSPMHRLIQGDVGSGKTVVALASILIAYKNGYQAALMAPTEILAEQHYLTIKSILNNLGISPYLLLGSLKVKEKKEIYARLKENRPAVVIGTHAIIQESVAFSKLGLVVIDEQHRFGVMQRAELIRKGLTPDVLVLTATPIPRTLSFTIFGDLDHSIIDALPPGRQPITTVWRRESVLPKIYEFILEKVSADRQAYIVLPLIDESEKMDLKAATQLFAELKKSYFRDIQIGLLHGRMNSQEKEKIMNDFKEGKLRVLISTTVIEVGVDVPNATIMLIIHAERFGLAQLHQLRGRVGRGIHKSYCILVTPEKITGVSEERMKVLCQTHSGFNIAEEDLRLRGMGEILGARQHGLPEFKYINFVTDWDLINQAKDTASDIIKKDPHLRESIHQLLRQQISLRYRDRIKFLFAF